MEYYEVAAKWWADKIHKIGSAKAKTVRVFEKKLGEKIKERVEQIGQLSLECDYDPDMILGNIAKEVGVDAKCFPFKTNMHITPNKVRVSFGYGTGYEKIFPVQG